MRADVESPPPASEPAGIVVVSPFSGESLMPKFITIGYGNRAGYDRTPRAARNAAHGHDAMLVRRGAVMGIAGAPVQVRNPEARDMDEAVALAAGAPCAVAHGVIEVWPLQEPSGTE